MRPLTLLSVALVLVLAAAPALARRAVVEQAGNSQFRACYLTSEDPAEANYAILYKGVQVEVVGAAVANRYPVQVQVGARGVAAVGTWRGQPQGWVSGRFLRFLDAEAPAAAGEQPSGGTGTAGGIDLLGTSNGPGSGSTTANPTYATGGRGVYWLFTSTGKDAVYFRSLAANVKPAGQPNYVWQIVRADIAATGAACSGAVVVEVSTPEQVMEILQGGMVPKSGPSRVPQSDGQQVRVHAPADLAASDAKVLGFGYVGHSGHDGPLLDYGNRTSWKQLEPRYLFADAAMARMAAWTGQGSLEDRLVTKARVRCFGCNAGACFALNGRHESWAHVLAALWSKKRVDVFGHHASGSPNGPPSTFARFGVGGSGVVTRLDTPKLKYRFLTPAPDRPYDEISVQTGSDEERAEALSYYRDRRIGVRVTEGGLTVRAPAQTWVTYESAKDPVLAAVMQAVASRPLETRLVQLQDGRQVLAQVFLSTGQTDEAEKRLPQLQKLITSQQFQLAVASAAKRGGGTMDPNDFEPWYWAYMATLNEEQQRKHLGNFGLRACLCDDQSLTAQLGDKR